MIKNIIFDIGGVLADFDPIKVMIEMGMSPEEIKVVSENTVLGPNWKEMDRGVIPQKELFDIMLKDVPEEYHKDAIHFMTKGIADAVIPFPYACDLLKEFKEKGYNIYLLTNYPEDVFNMHWDSKFAFKKYVDGKIVSGTVKQIKPDLEIYETLLKTYKLNAEECVFLDDRLENVEGAKKAGIKAIHFTDFETSYAELCEILNN